MRSTVLWLATAAVVAGGQGLGRHTLSPSAVAGAVAVVWPLAIGLAVGAAFVERWRRWWLAAALLLVALARGMSTGDRSASAVLPVSVRGSDASLRTFAIREASWPGPTCQVVAVPEGVTDAAWLELPSPMCPLAAGDEIAVSTRSLRLFRGPAWPASVDPVATARGRGAAWTLQADHAWLRARESGEFLGGYWHAIASVRSTLWTRSRGDDPQAFVVSSLFGVRAALSSVRRRELGVAGLGHLIAVSGMQVSLVAWAAHRMLLRMLAPWFASIGLAFACSFIGVLGYVGLVGAEAPAVRAAIMVAALGLAATLGRPAHGLTVLASTSALMLMVRPSWVFDVGFQLSFAAMAAILRMPSAAGLVLQSWRVGWAIMPVIVWHFGETGAWAVPANAVAVPVFALWVTPLGILAVLLDPWLGELAWLPASWGGALILDVAHWFAMAPRIGPSWVAALALFLAVLGLWPNLAARPSWTRWAPSRILCVVVVAATWLRGTPPDAPRADWVAFGARRTPTVIVRADDGTACVRNPSGAGHAWPPLLDALGIAKVGVIRAGPAALEPRGGARDPPHIVALREELMATGRLASPGVCIEPTDAEIDAALDRCTVGDERPFVAVTGSEVQCFVAGDWRAPLRLH